MKVLYQIAFASLVFGSLAVVPASAYASQTVNSVHTHSLTYHDRTPKVHMHGSHSHQPHTS